MQLRAALFTPVAALLARDEGSGHAGGRGRGPRLDAPRQRRPSICSRAKSCRAPTPTSRAAAIRSSSCSPKPAWTPATIEPLARAIVAMVKETSSDRRTEPATLDALHLGEKLAAALPAGRGSASAASCAPSACRSCAFESVPEQMVFDLNWFAVQAGKPVQIVLANPDAMPHNLVIGQPGSLQEIGTKGGVMPPAGRPGREALRPRHAARAAPPRGCSTPAKPIGSTSPRPRSRANTSTSARFPATSCACTA